MLEIFVIFILYIVMFFLNDSDPSIIREKSVYPRFVVVGDRRRRPPASWTGPEASEGHWGHVRISDTTHTASEAVGSACSTTILCQYYQAFYGNP